MDWHDGSQSRSCGSEIDFTFPRAKRRHPRGSIISLLPPLPPRKIAKSFLANGMVGRGGGDRTCIPSLLSLSEERRYQPQSKTIARNLESNRKGVLLPV